MKQVGHSFAFINLPSATECHRIESDLDKVRAALLPERTSRLLPCLPSISYCHSRGFSYQRTCDFIFAAHHLKVNKSTLCRFLRKYPLLQDLPHVADHK